MYANNPMSVAIVTKFVNWNEEAVLHCSLFTPQQVFLVANVRAIFNCLLDEASQYSIEGLQRGYEALKEVANLRDCFAIGTTVSRRVAAAASAICLFPDELAQNYSEPSLNKQRQLLLLGRALFELLWC